MKFMPFSDFYFIFKLIFPFQNRGKRYTYLQVLTWRAGSARKLTWRARPLRGCDAAERPRGRAVGGPREAQVAHRARSCGRKPCVSTRATWTTVWGATWQEGGVGIWRAHGLVGLGKMIGAVTQ